MGTLNRQDAQQRLLPEMIPLLQSRYTILQRIHVMGPIGRRGLADALQLTEREVRGVTDALRKQGLIEATKAGMHCTDPGVDVLESLKSTIHEWSGITQLERKLMESLPIERVIIVPGNCEEDSSVKALLGKEAMVELVATLKNPSIIAVTGGSSVESMRPFLQSNALLQDSQFIAARGGIGNELQLHANTIVAAFAEQVNGQYRTLYLPEQLSEQAYETMLQEPMVQEMMKLYSKADIVIHGIGSAEEMAIRRSSSELDVTALKEKGAVSEAFGYYFDEVGNIVYQIQTIGIQLEQVHQSEKCIAVAGGKKKAEAIYSYLHVAPKQTVLITDEKAAKALLTRLSLKEI